MSGIFCRRFSLGSIAILLLCVSRPAAAGEELGVIPTPQRVEWGGEAVLVDESTRLVISPQATKSERFAVSELRDAIRDVLNKTLLVSEDGAKVPGGSNRIVIGKPATNPQVAALMKSYGLSLSKKMHDEGYVLGVGSAGIVIGAESDAGVMYGTMSLRQMLLSRAAGKPLPGVKIHDWPFMKMRGIQDEISYGQVSTMDNFKDMLRFLAFYKMNTMFIYLEDTFRFKKYPTIGVGRGALTKAQVDELEAFAKKYHIEIIPIFEMLGNQGALLMLDEVRPFAEYPGSHSFSVDDEAFEFLENCFDELTEAFDSKYFHAGLDESWDLGFGKSEAAVKRDGRGAVHAAHYRRLNKLLKKRGKKMIMYADIILTRPEILELIPKDIVLMDWQYYPAEHYKTIPILAKYDFPLMVMPGMNNWDRIFPTMSNAMINIRNFTLDGIKHGAIGSFTSTWGDNGSKNLRELLYYGYAYGAEVTWTPQSTDVGSFGKRFFTLHNGAGTSPYFESIYAHLEKWPWWFPLLDYFRHPFLPRKDEKPHKERELYRVGEDARVALDLIVAVAPLVKRRKGDLDYLKYCARSHRHYVRSQRLVRALNSFDKKTATPGAIRKAQVQFLKEAAAVGDETAALRETFRELWLRTNLPANLHYCIDDYDRLATVWKQTQARISRGEFAWDPRPASQWIYHPEGIDKKREVQHAYFRRSFEIKEGNLSRAGIQLQGDTHLKVYVNGRLLGEQFARRNLSAPVNPLLVKLYDIRPYLRTGKNVIAVEAHNYGTKNKNLDPGGPPRCGGFHFYGEIVAANGKTQTLVSDASWKVGDRSTEGWTGSNFDDAAWPAAKGDKAPTVWVTAPDFTQNFRGYSARR